MTIGEAQAPALGLAEAAEQDRHGMPSWRERGKIFAATSTQAADDNRATRAVFVPE
jgi:hypothetical protein